MSNPFKNIPNNFLEKWQNIADLLAQIINVPAALIMKTENEFMEVFISSVSKYNPYHPGDKEHWHGLYCETVIKSQKELLIPDALKDKKWDKNPDIKLGMIAYLGIPVNFPDRQAFGTICVLDNKGNQFSAEHKALLYQFKNVIELDLALIQSLDWNKNNEDFDIIQKLHEQNEEYLAINEELKAQSEEISEAKERAEENEAKYKAAFRTSPDSVNINKMNGEYVEINEGFTRLTEYTEKDVIGKLSSEINIWHVPEDRKKLIVGLKKNGIVENLESLFRTKDGALIPALMSAKIIYLNNEPHILSVTRAIVERKKMEQELIAAREKAEESEKRYRDLINNIRAGVVVHAADTSVIFCNTRATELLGLSEAQMKGLPAPDPQWKFVDEENTPLPIDDYPVMRILKSKKAINNQLAGVCRTNSDIAWLMVNGFPVLDDNDEISEIVISFIDITDRKQAEDELLEIKNRYQSLFENSLIGIGVGTPEGKIIHSNQAYADMLGYSIPELKKTEIKNFYKNPDDRKSIVNILQQKNKLIDFETQLIRKDGVVIDVLLNISRIYIKDKRFFQTSCQDISERKLAGERLRESEMRFRSTFDKSPVGSVIVGLDKCFIKCNEAFCNFIGYTNDELIGKTIADITYSEDKDLGMSDLKLLMEGKIESSAYIQKRYLHKDGFILWGEVSISLVRDSNKKPLYFLPVITDITERKQVEEELRKSEAFKKKMVSNIGDAIVIIDQNGINRYKSPNITKLFGWQPEELLGNNTWDIIHPDDVEAGQQFFGAILREPNATGTTEMRYKRKDGHYVWIEINVINLLHDKDIQGILGNYHDISERKNAELELIAAKEKAEESDRLKSAFLANMSHEIRTPMNGILGFTGLLLEPDLSSEQKEAYISIVNQSGQRMLNTVNDIVEISKIEAGIVTIDFKEVDVQARLDELIRFFTPEATKKGLKLTLENEAPKTVAVISTDQNKMDSILTNLIKNAIKYTESGTIKVGCTTSETHYNASLQFYVKDTGIGIPTNRIEAIFNRFEQADIEDTRVFEGSGLGLAIAKSYVEMLGGEIWVESEEGKGSTFYFTLLLREQAQEKTEEKETGKQIEKTSQIKNLDIIIAEDDENSALFLQTILKKESNKILLTKNGHETVEACRNNPDTDLVLMDIQMPEMNGYDATREIRKFNRNVIIIAQTAFAIAGDQKKSMDAGCNDYIAKPINKGALLEKIQKYFSATL